MNSLKPYTKYKPSGIAWLGDIPEHWEVKRIKYIFKEQDRRSDSGLEELLSVSHYTGVTKKSDRYKVGEELSNAKTLVGYKIVTEGDLVMNIMLAWNGSLGISRFNGITSPAYCVFKSQIGGEKYFGYLFRTKEAQAEFKKQSTGIIDSRLRLYPDKFFNIKTIIPRLSEQTAIANFLDYKTFKIDSFIKKKKQLIKLLNEQKAGIINDAVTKGLDANCKMKPSGIECLPAGQAGLGDIPEHWEVRKLSTVIISAELGGNYDSSLSGDGIPVMKMGNIDRGTIKLIKTEKLNLNSDFDTKHILRNQDFLFNTRNSAELVGKVAIWRDETSKALYNSNILRICFKQFISNEYMNYLFNSKSVLNILRLISKGTTSVSAIYYKDLSKIALWIPPLSDQTSIVSHIESETTKLNKAIATIEKEIMLVQEYKTALIAEAVTGKIDVREYVIPVIEEEENYEEVEDELSMVAEDGEEYGSDM